MTTRRQLLQLGSLSMLAPSLVCAQARSPRIGILSARPLAESFYAGGVVKRLEELGYRVYEYRSADGDIGRYTRLARELVEAKCDLMFAIGPAQTALALRDTQARAPVVFVAVDYDPVEKGVVSSLSRPSGNVTGIYVPQAELAVKRMQIMLEVAAGVRRLLVFSDVYSLEQLAAVRKTADAKPAAIPVEQADEFELAINGRTARTLAIRIPESILARATRMVN